MSAVSHTSERDVVQFELNEEKSMLREAARDYLSENLGLEKARALDEAGEFPLDLYREIALMGWLGIPFPEEYGGADGDPIDESIIMEELGRVMGPLASTYLITALTCGKTLRDLGTPEQCERWLTGIIDGSIIFAFALTEPQAGSDAAALLTRAVRDGDSWKLNGQKIWSTGAKLATHLLVMARSDDRPGSERGDVGMFVVETDRAGLDIRTIPKLGLHPTPSCMIFLDNVTIPADNVVGDPAGAWKHVTASLNRERLAISAMCTGMGQAALEVAMQYTGERSQFGQPIENFDAVQQHLAEIIAGVENSRALMRRAAWLETSGESSTRAASAAKVVSSEACVEAARRGMRVLGGNGYGNEYPMQRFLRDALIHPIAGGSNEIQKNIISDDLVRNVNTHGA